MNFDYELESAYGVQGWLDLDYTSAVGGPTAYSFNADPATYTITGVLSLTQAGRMVTAVPGTYTLTGFANQMPIGRWIAANTGTYALTGSAADLLAARMIVAAPGSYALTGLAALTVAGREVIAAPGSYVITGTAAATIVARAILANPAAYSLTGAAAQIIAARLIDAIPTSYGITGIAAGINRGRLLNADPASYIITAGGSGSYSDWIDSLAPAGYWRLGEPSGTDALDSSGNTLDGTYTNTPTLAQTGALNGDADTAVSFASASSEYVNVPDDALLDLADVWTTMAWVKRSSIGTVQAIISKGSGGYYMRFASDNKIELLKSFTSSLVKSTVTVTDTDTWHLVVGTKNGATVKIYLDGVDVTGTVTNATTVDNTNALWVGRDAGGEYFNGLIDEAAVFNYALTLADVEEAYDRGIGGGSTTILLAGRMLSAVPGSYSITGVAAQTLADRMIVGAPGSYVITGLTADLVHGVTLGDFVLSADPAAYALTGIAANLLTTRLIVSSPASYAITGLSALTEAGRMVVAAPGAYAVTGSAALTVAGRILAAVPGSYLITGTDAAVVAGRIIVATPGVYAINGVAATFVLGTTGIFVLNADPASYLITGFASERGVNDDGGSGTGAGQSVIVIGRF